MGGFLHRNPCNTTAECRSRSEIPVLGIRGEGDQGRQALVLGGCTTSAEPFQPHEEIEQCLIIEALKRYLVSGDTFLLKQILQQQSEGDFVGFDRMGADSYRIR